MTRNLAPTSGARLARGVLGWKEALAQSLAVLFLPAVGAATAAAAANAAGAAPLAFVVAGAGCLCLASVVIRFTSRMASAGGIYTFIARGLGPNAGFVGGWLYGGAFTAAISLVLAIGSATMSELLTNHTRWHPGWISCFLILLLALLALALLDIRLSMRVQLILGAASAGAILLLALIVLAKGGDAGVTAEPFNPARLPSVHGLFLAVVFGFAAFIGFEAAAALGEEAAEPRRAIPRAILAAAIVVVVWYVFIAWAISLGFGVEGSGRWAEDIAPLDALAMRYAGTWLSVLVDLAVVTGSLVAALGGVHLTARTIFTMGRDGALPRSVAWTHPRHRSPWVAIAATLALTALLGLLLGPRWDAPAPAPFPYVQMMAITVTIAILTAYILVALSGMRFFWRTRQATDTFSMPFDIIVPLVAIAFCGCTIYESVHPLPASPVGYGAWIVPIWVAIGLVILLVLNLTNPERVRRFGSILGDGGTTGIT